MAGVGVVVVARRRRWIRRRRRIGGSGVRVGGGGVGCTVCPPRETRGAASPLPLPAVRSGFKCRKESGAGGGDRVACCHTMSNQYELPRAVGPPRHISGKVAPLRRDGCSFEIHFNASPQHSHMAPFSGTPGNGLLCRDQGGEKRPRGRSPTIAA